VSIAAGVGHYVPWDGGCLLIGDDVQLVPPHAHYAIQITFGSERGVRFRTGEGEEWGEYDVAIIPSRQPHSMDARRVRSNAVIFVEPETREGRTLAELYLRDGIASVTERAVVDAGAALFAAWRERRERRTVTEAAWRVIQALTRGVEPSVVSDERILRAVAYINAHLDAPLTLEEVAAEACLSPSRFRHLFVEQTGMGLRPYVLWRRFLRAWDLVMAGESLSTAAHGAGFADAAHLTRTSRRMFGFPPSALQLSEPLPSGHVDRHHYPPPPGHAARTATPR
jgi:AraC family transcriptional regulator